MKREGYQRCEREDVPPGIRWGESGFSPKGYIVMYGNPGDEEKAWGAPFRRVVCEKKKSVTYYRLVRGTKGLKERDA